MKYLFSLILLTAAFPCLSQKTFNIKKDFGAKGDARSDDTRAFLKAFERINQIRTNVVLIIPAGTYILKPQVPAPQSSVTPFLPLNIISLVNCSNITIKGEKGSKIQFAPGLYYGSFRRNGNKVVPYGRRTTDYSQRVAIGHGVYIENSSRIQIQSLEFDGNNRNFILGSEYGDVGMQIDNDGLFITDNSEKVTLTNLFIHHFGRDGLLVITNTPKGFDTPVQHIMLTNCRFEWNGRQGFSWAGGSGITAINCFFRNTGKGKFSSPPSAGLDIEPNAGYIATKGVFINCRFENNSGVAVLADEGGFLARDVNFINCTITGNTTAALWIKSPAFTFTECKILGTFYFGVAAKTPEEGTKFSKCYFSDESSLKSLNNYLVESNGSRYLSFDQCEFKVQSKGFIYIATGHDAPALINNSRIVIRYKNKTAPGFTLGAFTTGVRFTGNTSFVDSSVSRFGWNMEKSIFGSNDKPSSINVYGGYALASYDSVKISGKSPTNVTLFKDAVFSMLTNSQLIIEKGSVLRVKKGANLWIAPGAELIVRGKLIAEEGAFICIHHEAKITDDTRKNLEMQGKINYTDNTQLKLGLGGCITIGKK